METYKYWPQVPEDYDRFASGNPQNQFYHTPAWKETCFSEIQSFFKLNFRLIGVIKRNIP